MAAFLSERLPAKKKSNKKLKPSLCWLGLLCLKTSIKLTANKVSLTKCHSAGSQAPAWEPLLGSSGFQPSPPRRANLYQSLISRIIPDAGISPMLSLINLASLDRVLMNIVLFLPKHRLTFYDLRVTAFLPDLANGFLFMRTLEMWSGSQAGAWEPENQSCKRAVSYASYTGLSRLRDPR